jgi:hypothetical protein
MRVWLSTREEHTSVKTVPLMLTIVLYSVQKPAGNSYVEWRKYNGRHNAGQATGVEHRSLKTDPLMLTIVLYSVQKSPCNSYVG